MIPVFNDSADMTKQIFTKIRFKPNENWDLQYSFMYAKTSDAPRYDRLIQYRNGALRFAEWYYGPMKWNMHNLQILNSKKQVFMMMQG